jgi:hypothetical protein
LSLVFASALLCSAEDNVPPVTVCVGEHSQVCVTKRHDQLLFEAAMDAAEHGKLDIANVTLQTLVNTYPNSAYAAKARLKLKEPQIAFYCLQKQGWIIDCAVEAQIPTITSVVPDSLEIPKR